MTGNFIIPDNMKGPHVKAFFTTRHSGNDLSSLLPMSGFSDTFFPRQKHTDRVYILHETSDSITADAVITKKKDILIGVSVADCVPVLLTNEAQDIIGVIHAGWRGTASAITRKTLESIEENFHVQSDQIVMAIGPSIGKCCYHVGSEVIEKVTEATGPGDYVSTIKSKFFLNLKEANRTQALSQGVKPQNIWMSPSCTCCESDKFFSYRCQGKTNKRQAGFIGMDGRRK